MGKALSLYSSDLYHRLKVFVSLELLSYENILFLTHVRTGNYDFHLWNVCLDS